LTAQSGRYLPKRSYDRLHKYTIAPGRYELPFSAQLPPGLPSTMYAEGGGGHCSVAYQIVARLSRPGMFAWDVVARQAIDVQATPLVRAPQPHYAPPTTQRLSACCCLSTGEMTFAAVLADTLVSRGGRLDLGIALRNESTSAARRVYAELREHVSWHARGHSNHSLRCVGVAEWEPLEMDGVRPRSSAELKAAAADPGSRGALLGQLHAALLGGGDRRALEVGADARESYEGGLLSVRHQLTLHVRTPACVRDPSLELPVRVAQRVGAASAPPAGAPVLPMPSAPPLGREEVATAKLLKRQSPADWAARRSRRPSCLKGKAPPTGPRPPSSRPPSRCRWSARRAAGSARTCPMARRRRPIRRRRSS
jgi:hypothetical protein